LCLFLDVGQVALDLLALRGDLVWPGLRELRRQIGALVDDSLIEAAVLRCLFGQAVGVLLGERLDLLLEGDSAAVHGFQPLRGPFRASGNELLRLAHGADLVRERAALLGPGLVATARFGRMCDAAQENQTGANAGLQQVHEHPPFVVRRLDRDGHAAARRLHCFV
jgi:hypothetical protein